MSGEKAKAITMSAQSGASLHEIKLATLELSCCQKANRCG